MIKHLMFYWLQFIFLFSFLFFSFQFDKEYLKLTVKNIYDLVHADHQGVCREAGAEYHGSCGIAGFPGIKETRLFLLLVSIINWRGDSSLSQEVKI
jgi:hypothetical protein